MNFKETQYLLDVVHHCSVLLFFPSQKLLCRKFPNFLLRNKALVYLLYLIYLTLTHALIGSL